MPPDRLDRPFAEDPIGELEDDEGRAEQVELLRRVGALDRGSNDARRDEQEQDDSDRGGGTPGGEARDRHRQRGVEKRRHGSGREDVRQELQRLGDGRPVSGEEEGEQHEEQRAERDQEHGRKDTHSLRHQIAIAIERPGEVEAEHPRALVRAQRLGSDERGEETERAPDDEHVVAVGDEVAAADVLCEHRVQDGGERRQIGDRKRERRQHLVARPSSEPEHAPGRELGERQDRSRRTLARSVIPPVAKVVELCVAGGHAPAPR